MIPIIIPSCKRDVSKVVREIKRTVDLKKYEIIPTCVSVSAPTNRNYGLSVVFNSIEKNGIVIMCDDDIKGFFSGWANALVSPLIDNENIIMASARLITPKKDPAVMMDIVPDFSVMYQFVQNKALPSSCIAFRWDKVTWFDELYSVDNRGSGFEDTDFCMQLHRKNPALDFVICNACELIHINEQKNQSGYMGIFYNRFKKKWGIK